jgi:hypothetical protein
MCCAGRPVIGNARDAGRSSVIDRSEKFNIVPNLGLQVLL